MRARARTRTASRAKADAMSSMPRAEAAKQSAYRLAVGLLQGWNAAGRLVEEFIASVCAHDSEVGFALRVLVSRQLLRVRYRKASCTQRSRDGSTTSKALTHGECSSRGPSLGPETRAAWPLAEICWHTHSTRRQRRCVGNSMIVRARSVITTPILPAQCKSTLITGLTCLRAQQPRARPGVCHFAAWDGARPPSRRAGGLHHRHACRVVFFQRKLLSFLLFNGSNALYHTQSRSMNQAVIHFWCAHGVLLRHNGPLVDSMHARGPVATRRL